MSAIEITNAEIAGLAVALDGLTLTDGQRALLSAIVTMAAHAMSDKSDAVTIVDGPETAVSFQDQFAASFTPGTSVASGTDTPPAEGLTVVMGKSFKIGR